MPSEAANVAVHSTAVFAGPGALAELCRKRDWSASPLGELAQWSEALCAAVRACLDDPLPRCLYVGADAALVYNDAYVELLGGLRHPWALGCAARDVWGELWERLGALVERVLTGGTALRRERDPFVYARELERSERIYLTYGLAPVRDRAGHVIAVAGTFIDETCNVRAEASLRESEHRYRQLIDASPDAVLVDVGDRTFYANAAAARLVGADRADQLVDRPTLAYVAPCDREAAAAQISAAVSRDAADVAHGQRWQRIDGSEIDVEVTVMPALWRGQPARQLQIRDVTARRAAERALCDADRRKDEFLATLAHELRNPLAPIRSAVRILERPGLPEKDVATCRDIIRRQTQNMAWLLDELLDVSRVTRGRIQLRREPLPLDEVVEAALEITRPLLNERRHRVQVRVAPAPPWVDADRVRLAQVLTNLLTNAAKYTDAGGEIELTLDREGDEARIVVRDSGIGLAAEHLGQVFEMFSQVEGALHRAQGGLGIGLALVRGLVALHGGRVEARSAGIGQGSEFVIHLPAIAPPPAVASSDREARVTKASRALRVLLADDNRDAARTLQLYLSLAGHEVHVEHDGTAALAAAARLRPDVVLLDIGMPGLNGYEVAERLRREPWGGGLRLIALTGWGQETDRTRARAAGFDHHVTKPTDPEALLALLGGSQGAAAPA